MDKTTAISKIQLLYLNIALPALAFTIPFIIAGPQWLIGTIVNCFLFLFATYLPKKNTLPIVALPSLSALLRGVVFGPYTPFLVFFLPFIWLGNYSLIYIYKKTAQYNYFFRIALSAFIKFVILFLTANLYFRLHLVPKLFITSMGVIQLITALSGGIVSFIIIKLINKKYE